ncbi:MULTISPECIES: acyl--CoA ligase [Brevibacillus]|uniref:Acyl--CoA ligase n=1 Tax=Brevibacillus invocatus TaxID=173959 RepID=A0A3M8CK50_9BACL|nr:MULTISPECIES: acyl--CoA ligase [Brevibacillus]MCM3077784.1 acyl--CoA ligase [Brevibacillus invocatus]MCM3428142.1 acyl--CoA ligase [Brevibacillus invocatus]MDH4616126.1 acyl--CoA ligase [Brevibacillus sp. AY1]RNB75245.1 acyl--CoA ligase [Brevibacillus invocatus]
MELNMPEYYNFAAQVDEYACSHPDKRAVWELDESGAEQILSYDQLRRFSNRIANGLQSIGIGQGDKVVVLVKRGIEAYGIYLALLKVGAVIMPGSEMLRQKDIEYRVDHAQACGVICFEGILEEVEPLRESSATLKHFITLGDSREGWLPLDVLIGGQSDEFSCAKTRSDELAFLSYTSGTTGGPKGVMHVSGWPLAHLSIAASQWLDVRENDLVWATAGPGWAKWIWSPFVSTLGMGATAFVYKGRFSAEAYLSILEKYPVSVLCATPTEYRIMAKANDLEQYRLQALRSPCSAGEPLNREVIDTFRRVFGLTVRDGYGQTESTLLVGTFVGMEPKPGSMGRPSPVVRVAIVDEEGMELPVGKVGDIAINRDMIALFQGYLNDPERTAKAYRGEWYVTGDQGRMDEDGYIWFEGRSDDIIISGGYTIGPFEVEDALVKHPSVAECAAVASPDDDRGSVVKAFVILKKGHSPSDELVEELKEHVKHLTAPYKYPRKIEFVEELPKTNSGKIRRVELRQQEKENLNLS